jgi:hypothetical protein
MALWPGPWPPELQEQYRRYCAGMGPSKWADLFLCHWPKELMRGDQRGEYRTKATWPAGYARGKSPRTRESGEPIPLDYAKIRRDLA